MSQSTFDRAAFEALRATRTLSLGAPLVTTDVTGSTNDDALRAARSGAAHGALFVTDAQTHGRGRRGRTWFAHPGESLLCSVVLRLALPVEALGGLALATGAALRSAIAQRLPETVRDRVKVKWPNDVWVDDLKIAGVLAESHLQGGVPVAIVIGFGVNVMTKRFPDELSRTATSLARLGIEASREALLIDSLAELERRVDILATRGIAALSTELAHHDALFGLKIRIDGQAGTARGIDAAGRLVVETETGELLRLTGGTVEPL